MQPEAQKFVLLEVTLKEGKILVYRLVQLLRWVMWLTEKHKEHMIKNKQIRPF